MKIPLVGPSYESRSLPFSCQRTINLYPEQAGAAASAASAVTLDVHHLSGQVAEVDRKIDEVVIRQDSKAAEQTQLRAAVEDLTRIVGTEARPPKESPS